MLRPNLTQTRVDEKLLSIRITFATYLAASEPSFIAKPTSAIVRAGQSLVPSPVTATIALFSEYF
jgi:hypothetical protein